MAYKLNFLNVDVGALVIGKIMLRRHHIVKNEIKLQSETERLILRALQNRDNNRWLEGWRGILPSLYKYDDN